MKNAQILSLQIIGLAEIAIEILFKINRKGKEEIGALNFFDLRT